MLAIEAAIRTRLAERMSAGVLVVSMADLSGLADTKLAPAVYVAFDGYRVLEQQPYNPEARVETRWLTVVATRNLKSTATGSDARADAAAIVDAVYTALAAWRPAAGYKPLALAEAPRPGFDAGFFYLPLAWRTETILRGA